MAFYQKYRAKTFGEMVGQAHVVGTLLQSLKSDRSVHAFLLTGPRGIGKTSTARLLAKALNCEKTASLKKEGKDFSGEPCNECSSCLSINEGKSIDVIEIDAASNTGVDNIRNLIEKARLAPTSSYKKVYIIDEVHMLSKGAFNALLKTLEEPPAHVVFVLATTEVQKIPATILSRTQQFHFKRASKKDIITNLKRVSEKEKIDITPEALDLIATVAEGGHRDALGLLEQVSGAEGKITVELTREILGLANNEETLKLAWAIFNNNPEEGLKIARDLFENGGDLLSFNRNLLEFFRRLLLLKSSKEILFEDTAENIDSMKEVIKSVSHERLLDVIGNFIDASKLLRDSSYPILPLEIAIIKSIRPEGQQSDGPMVIQADSQSVPKPRSPIVNATRIENHADTKSSDDQTVELSDNKTVGLTSPVPVMEMTKDIWGQILAEIKCENATLFALLRDADPDGMTDDTLNLAVKFKFHKDRISEEKNRCILEEAVSKVVGHKLKITCKEQKNKLKPASEKIDLVKTVGEIFEVEN